jgi:uncharacterized damage-inducible protein DinB
MSERARIADQFRRMMTGEAWHGPSFAEALRGITVEQAGQRAVSGGHTVYELVHHIGAWIAEVTRRLEGRGAREPDDGDFPPPTVRIDAAEWDAVQRRLAERTEAFLRAIERFAEDRLDERVGDERNPPLGTGHSFYGTAHGVIEHTAYHVGQLMLLRKALGVQ